MKARVPKHQNPREFVTVDTEATKGATIGTDVRNPDGSLYVPAAPSTATPSLGASIWRYILEIPANIVALAGLTGTGVVRRTGDSTFDVATTTTDVPEGSRLYFTDQRARVAASAGLSTGILSGGALSINATNPATLDIAAGRGFVINNTVVPPTVTVVEWAAKIGVPITDLTTAQATDIAIDAAGNVVQQRSFTSAQLRQVIFLGGVDHSNNVQIQNIFSIQVPVYAPALSVRDLAAGIGDLNISGNQFTANGATLQVNKSEGRTFSFGRNAAVSAEDPNRIIQFAQSPVTFRYVFDNGSGVANFGVERTTIDSDNYDGGAGALAPVGVNRYSIQRFLLFANSNNVLIQYGPNTYNKLDDALQSIAAEGFKNLVGTTTALSRGFLIVKQGTTSLADPANARFLIANRFGALEAAGTPSTGSVLLNSYTVAGVPSATPSGQMIYVTNEVGGAVAAVSDGTNWRRTTDRAVIS